MVNENNSKNQKNKIKLEQKVENKNPIQKQMLDTLTSLFLMSMGCRFSFQFLNFRSLS